MNSREYYDEIASHYDELYQDPISIAENNVVAHLLAILVESGDSVIDLGCGTGLAVDLLPARRETDYLGIDISERMIEVARRRRRQNSFKVADMESLPLFPETADVVISLFGSFSHSLNPDRAVCQIERILKPGGRFMIMAYSRWSYRNIIQSIRAGSPSKVAMVQRYSIRNSQSTDGAPAIMYTAAALKKLFGRFENLSVFGLNAQCLFEPFAGLHSRRNTELGLTNMLLHELWNKTHPNFAHTLIITGTKK